MDFEHGPFEESLRGYIGVIFAGVFLFNMPISSSF